MKNFIKIYKSIRKPIPPPPKVETPTKGGRYKRPKNKKDIHEEE